MREGDLTDGDLDHLEYATQVDHELRLIREVRRRRAEELRPKPGTQAEAERPFGSGPVVGLPAKTCPPWPHMGGTYSDPGREPPEPPGWIVIEVDDYVPQYLRGGAFVREHIRAATIVSVFAGRDGDTVIRVIGGTFYTARNTTVTEVLRKVDEALRV